jgi:hypothetical protein
MVRCRGVVRHLGRPGRAGPFYGRGDPSADVIARLIVHSRCWPDFLEFDDELQEAIWRQLDGGDVISAPAVVEHEPEPVSDSPFGNLPVIHAGSPVLGALMDASRGVK